MSDSRDSFSDMTLRETKLIGYSDLSHMVTVKYQYSAGFPLNASRMDS